GRAVRRRPGRAGGRRHRRHRPGQPRPLGAVALLTGPRRPVLPSATPPGRADGRTGTVLVGGPGLLVELERLVAQTDAGVLLRGAGAQDHALAQSREEGETDDARQE